MIWQQLSLPWQAATEEAWAAYCAGSVPHGAVLTDADGQIVARGRNRINDKHAEGSTLHGHRMAHAELNALIQTDWSKVNPRTSILYSTIEPCPMCIGAIRMANVHEVRYVARDNTSGAISLLDKMPYLKNANIQIRGSEDAILEAILLAIFITSALSFPAYPNKEAWADQLAQGVPVAGLLGRSVYKSQQLLQWKEEGKDAAFVIDQLAEQARQITATL